MTSPTIKSQEVRSRPEAFASRLLRELSGDVLLRFIGRPVDASDRIAVRIVTTLFWFGLAFDSIKAAYWLDWRPRRELGPFLYVIYFLCNLAVPVLAIALRRTRIEFFQGHVTLALCVFSSGILNWLTLLFTIQEGALIPLVYHGMFAFFAGTMFFLNTRVIQIVESNSGPSTNDWQFQRREGFAGEFRFLLGLGYAATFAALIVTGFSFGLLLFAKARNGWVPTDPDFQATGIQLCLGLGICLFINQYWGTMKVTLAKKWMEKESAEDSRIGLPSVASSVKIVVARNFYVRKFVMDPSPVGTSTSVEPEAKDGIAGVSGASEESGLFERSLAGIWCYHLYNLKKQLAIYGAFRLSLTDEGLRVVEGRSQWRPESSGPFFDRSTWTSELAVIKDNRLLLDFVGHAHTNHLSPSGFVQIRGFMRLSITSNNQLDGVYDDGHDAKRGNGPMNAWRTQASSVMEALEEAKQVSRRPYFP